jgi:tRNA/tmRNA/rRNA uracil-C5-methylase (TrmA/RlmC/RlmD family)
VLREAGYALTGLQSFDAFPMTAHVETVAVLTPAA